jgi:hypothetical protein
MSPERDPSIRFCPDCGWGHANVPGCWRKVMREAREKLAEPAFTGPIRDKLQAALDAAEASQRELIEFFTLANAITDDEDADW